MSVLLRRTDIIRIKNMKDYNCIITVPVLFKISANSSSDAKTKVLEQVYHLMGEVFPDEFKPKVLTIEVVKQ